MNDKTTVKDAINVDDSTNTSLLATFKAFTAGLSGLLGNADYSLSTNLADHVENLENDCKESKPMKYMMDAFGNEALGIGKNDKIASFNNYGFDNNPLNYYLWTALYADSWTFRIAIDKPATDMARSGVIIENKTDKKDDIDKMFKLYTNDLANLYRWGALYGGSVAVMMFDGLKDADYRKPLNKEWLKKKKPTMKLYVTDRWYGCATDASRTVSKMTDPDYGKPMKYRIMFGNGHELTVHHSFILRYEHRVAPNIVKNGQLQGWGYPEGCHILNELSRDDNLKASIQSLVNKSLIEVIKMPGMRGVYMGSKSEDATQLEARLGMVNWARNFNSLTLLDSDDEYQEHSFSVGGLADLLNTNFRLVAAALEMTGVLYGDLDGGFSADTIAYERYDETIANRKDAYAKQVVQKLLSIIFIINDVDEIPDFSFKSLLSTKQDKDKVEALKAFTDLVGDMMDKGLLTPKQAAKAMQMYSTKHIIDFGYTDEIVEQLSNEAEESIEGIDIDKEIEKRKKKMENKEENE